MKHRIMDTASILTYLVSRRQRQLSASLDPLKDTIIQVARAAAEGRATLNPELCHFTVELLDRIAAVDRQFEADLLMLAGRLRRQDDRAANSYLT